LPVISALGAALVVIAPQVERLAREPAEAPQLDFTLLVDRGNLVARRYGLVFELPHDLRDIYLKNGIDLPRANGDGSWTLPMPARFVIDMQGVIRAADAHPDYTRRPDPDETIAILRSLRAAESL
jgi:peroxiredoxin